MVVVPQDEYEEDDADDADDADEDEDGEHGGHVPHTPYVGQSDDVASDNGTSDEVGCPLAIVRESSSTGTASLATTAVS